MGEQEIELEQENIIITAGGAVNSVNGYTGDVVLTTSDLENTSDYQTGANVTSAISAHNESETAHPDIRNLVTAEARARAEADTTLQGNINSVSADIGVEAAVREAADAAITQSVINERVARQNADTDLQNQIDAISASSDVKDIVGTKADLNNYDTSTLSNNDIIKVLQDESEDDATTYYRWDATDQQFVLIGEEGPYYTKAATDALLDAKQDVLTAGSNITIDSNNEISATDTTYTAGTGLNLAGTTFSADTTVLATQTDLAAKQNVLTAGTNIQISNDTISATDTTYNDFVGTDGTAAGTSGLVPAPATTDAGKFLKADGTWDTAGGGSGPTVVQATGTSTTDVMSQNAATSMIYSPGYDPVTSPSAIRWNLGLGYGLGNSSFTVGTSTGTRTFDNGGINILGKYCQGLGSIAIGADAGTGLRNSKSTAIGVAASTGSDVLGGVALGAYSNATSTGEANIGSTNTSYGYNSSNYRLLTGLYDPQNAHDAATKGYVDGLVGNISTVLQTLISGTGATGA